MDGLLRRRIKSAFSTCMRIRAALPCLFACVAAASCATSGGPVETEVTDAIRTATGANVRFGAPTPGAPANVRLDDGLSRDEAVAIALWNNAAFQVSLSQLGFARADLVDAGLLTNPTLSLLFPVGPKQLEATLRLPAELLWGRPRRIKAAKLSLAAAARGLVQSGLDLALAVRLAHTDLAFAIDRQALASETAAALQRTDTLTQSRLNAGDIAELDARAARVDALRAAQEAERAVHDVTVARERLRLLLGMPASDPSVDVLEPAGPVEECGAVSALLERALAARPDLRAAELGVEAAAARLGWERSRILTLVAVLDANGAGREGFESGPGVDVGIPLFNRNQGGQLRARSDLQRASAVYVQMQQQVALDVRESAALLAQARQSRLAWGDRIVAPLRANLADAEESFAAGETSYLFVLENSRRLIEARVREREIAAEERRAQARIERAAGMRCQTASGGPR